MPTFTVTVAGPERHEGHKPYTYVIDAESMEAAKAAVLAHQMAEEAETTQTGDVVIVDRESFPGEPPNPCGYWWNDLRKVSETA